MQRAEELIRSTDLPLPVSKARLLSALLPRVGFSSYPWMPRGLPLGASRFGGPADLPAGVDWPRVNGRPLLLLAQLNFGQLPIKRRHPIMKLLPERGWFCLFLDVDGVAQGVAGDEPGVVALQFEGEADKLFRHDPKPAPDACPRGGEVAGEDHLLVHSRVVEEPVGRLGRRPVPARRRKRLAHLL